MSVIKPLISNFLLYFPFLDPVLYPQVLIAVQSGPKNKERRDEVRRTWGRACKTVHQSWCSVVFVLGEDNIFAKYY